jgi:hypothetical protein
MMAELEFFPTASVWEGLWTGRKSIRVSGHHPSSAQRAHAVLVEMPTGFLDRPNEGGMVVG